MRKNVGTFFDDSLDPVLDGANVEAGPQTGKQNM
jgi:hypothetical protein